MVAFAISTVEAAGGKSVDNALEELWLLGWEAERVCGFLQEGTHARNNTN